MAILETLIIPGICVGIVYGIKEFFWKENIPRIIEKLRWLIAIVIAILINIFGALLNVNMEITPFFAAGCLAIIPIVLKNKIEYTCSDCNNIVDVNDKFCTNCGAELKMKYK